MGFTLVSPYSLKPLKGSKQSSIKHPYPFPRLPIFSPSTQTQRKKEEQHIFFKFQILQRLRSSSCWIRNFIQILSIFQTQNPYKYGLKETIIYLFYFRPKSKNLGFIKKIIVCPIKPNPVSFIPSSILIFDYL